MPFKKNNPGCDCCGGGRTCGDGCNAGTSPAEVLVRIAMCANNFCADCDNANGDWLLPQHTTLPCKWEETFADTICLSGGLFDMTVTAVVNDMLTYRKWEVVVAFGPNCDESIAYGPIWRWTTTDASFDCSLQRTLPLIEWPDNSLGYGCCDWSAATCLLIPQ